MEQSGNLERIESEEMERTIITAVDGGVSLDKSDSKEEALIYSSSKKSEPTESRESLIVDKLNEAIRSKAYISGVGVRMTQFQNLKPPIDPLKKKEQVSDPKKGSKLSKYQQSREKMKKKKLNKKVQELAQHIQ